MKRLGVGDDVCLKEEFVLLTKLSSRCLAFGRNGEVFGSIHNRNCTLSLELISGYIQF